MGQRKKTQEELERDEILKRKIPALNRRRDGDSSQDSTEHASGYIKGTALKHKRGLVKGNKTAMVVRRIGQRIKLDYNEATRFPSNRETWSGLARDLGAAIRDEGIHTSIGSL